MMGKEAMAAAGQFGEAQDAPRPWMSFPFQDRPDWWWAIEIDSKPAFEILATLEDYNRFVGVKKAVCSGVVF